ncbi:MAG: hypothetical protein DWH81_10475 [Planctomycetota bacterium]|nr:MAG: hypothetical protein DWH81_10475 [Planctomycetota bacterium]
MQRSNPASLAFAFAALFITLFWSDARGDSLRLKSGLIYSGKTVPLRDPAVYSSVNPRAKKTAPSSSRIWMVDDGPRRLCFPSKQVAEIDPGNKDLSERITFNFPMHRTGRAAIPDQIGSFSRIEEFDEFGHGMVQLRTADAPMDVILGIAEMRPDYVNIESLSHDWSFARTTQSLGAETIDKILKQKIDNTQLQDRKSVIIFYEQAEMYKAAHQEVEALARDFPSEQSWCQETLARMNELDARLVINALTRFRDAGQHELVESALKRFPQDGVSADIQRQVLELSDKYQTNRERREHILFQLDMLQSQLPEEQAAHLRPLRSLLNEELNANENLERLTPYEQVAEDEQIPADQKLALAYSSWVVGPTDAVDSLPTALRMWEMRFLMQEYLRTPENSKRREEIVHSLEKTEDALPELLTRIVEFLPVFEDSDPIPAGVPTTVEFNSEGSGEPLSYVVVLPKEYKPQHTYPLLVVMHSMGATPEKEAVWWAGNAEREGQAQRRGFITIAPRYAKEKQTEHEFDIASHLAVLSAIRHAMRTHRIDGNRVILAGHGMGADACFDLGMAHPDVFAGVAPICGRCLGTCKYYWENSRKLPWYVVSGQRDRNTVAENMRDLNRLFNLGADIIYCEFKERGIESFVEELPRLMDWAETVRRKPLTEFMDFEVRTQRAFDNRFYWLESTSLPPEMSQPPTSKTWIMDGKITQGGTIYIKHPGKTATIWLHSEMAINLNDRIRVLVNGTERLKTSWKPSAGALLEDLLRRADRQRVFTMRIDVK